MNHTARILSPSDQENIIHACNTVSGGTRYYSYMPLILALVLVALVTGMRGGNAKLSCESLLSCGSCWHL